ncbi:MAG TPA: MerR family transcriptional regulator [Gemmatimonadaceae bacterium]|nr:MerR family transcriptional regulator [Gemmatimonadaceae bacterium]
MNPAEDGTDSRYSIGVVTRRTGLSPDVLRVWERRYAVVAPTRSAGGQRLYSASDIEKLRLLRRLVEGGHRIASVARLDLDTLAALAREVAEHPAPASAAEGARAADDLIDDLMLAVEGLDDVALETALRRASMTLGTEAWIESVVAPFLTAVGDRWHAGTISPAHEHLATATVRTVLGWVMRSFSATADAPLILVATPVGELHELGAMMAAVTAAEAGWRVRYLGPDIPAADLATAATQIAAQAIALSVVHPDNAARTVREIHALRLVVPATVPILVGGSAGIAASAALARAGATIIADPRALRAELAGLMPVS